MKCSSVVLLAVLCMRVSGQTTHTNWQRDYPFGWAPIQLLAIESMRRSGYDAEADRVWTEFLSTVLDNFRRDKTTREKYNVVRRSSETKAAVGYAANVIGFGWTNAAFLELLHALPREKVNHLVSVIPVVTSR